MANPRERERAIALLRARPHRSIYEGGAAGGKLGSGKYYVTYTGDEPSGSPVIDSEDIKYLLLEGIIVEEYIGSYCLMRTSTADSRQS